ncbi:putative Na+/H+ antiporter [Oxalobacter vibrioformis]|uniref:Na+/H+ antiporter n=1 Tax=Oxalobacter vibrioformis TaxID=933080 RepID=A0A9E9M0P5_9BURK|nr:putative Na+/H+ antiporter [Oxalobacter vibrioformis]WAW11034.1 putative Na+/H+ antiporter [Oxalobacter vibrioformis]
MTQPQWIEYTGAALFLFAVLHTFSTKFFIRLANKETRHAGLWHLLGEVEVVFGFWTFILLVFLAVANGSTAAVDYLDAQNFTEPLFVFVILVIAGTRPVLQAARLLINILDRLIPLPKSVSYYFLLLAVVPLLGSFITEPAAMTLAALMLRDRYLSRRIPESMKYLTFAILLVNVSIGGVLTPYAAPPVLMVAEKWGWGMDFMLSMFGWKAALAVFINALAATWIFRRVLLRLDDLEDDFEIGAVPPLVMGIHLAFLAGTVIFSHHPAVFLGLFLFFLGFTEAYKQYQSPLMLREGLLVAFFLAGLVVLGSMQKWWLQPVLAGMDSLMLFIGSTLLTAITDNAALTYLGSLVEGLSDANKYALVAGAVTGGGLTVIANAPNPAGFSILKGSFEEESINPMMMFLFALPPTVIAACCFFFL